jgi:hypothetical protein
MDEHSRTIILNATALRAQGGYDEAIDLIQRHIHEIEPVLVFNAYREIFLSAHAKDDKRLAQEAARKLAAEYPDLPLIQSYLP